MLLVHSVDSLKTLAFALPILQQLAVVLTPTWELAMQIGDSFRILGRAGMNLHDHAEDNLDQKYMLTPPEARDSYLVQLLLSR